MTRPVGEATAVVPAPPLQALWDAPAPLREAFWQLVRERAELEHRVDELERQLVEERGW